ncbi:MAG: hypothetical protein Q8904_07870 [Bacteroidota bacterium]|nr:hypothetical protein [Bacteroidota bacterium]
MMLYGKQSFQISLGEAKEAQPNPKPATGPVPPTPDGHIKIPGSRMILDLPQKVQLYSVDVHRFLIRRYVAKVQWKNT